MNFRSKLTFVVVALCALSFLGGVCIANAQDSTMKVIGKAHIKKGTTLGGAIEVAPGMSTSFVFVAFEDTVVYLTKKLDPVEGTHSGGYLADASGFPQDCPVHGKEILGAGTIGIPHAQIEDMPDNIRIELF